MRLFRTILFSVLILPSALMAQSAVAPAPQAGGVSTEFPVDHESYIPGLNDLRKSLQGTGGGRDSEDGLGAKGIAVSSVWDKIGSDKTVANGIILLLLVSIFIVYKLKSGKKHGR